MFLFSIHLLFVIQIVHFIKKFSQINLKCHVTLLLILFAAFNSDEIVVFKLVQATKKFWVVHPWNLVDLAAHLVDGIENLRVRDKFFLAFIFKDSSYCLKKHKVLSRLTPQRACNF